MVVDPRRRVHGEQWGSKRTVAREVITSPEAPAPVGPYSHAVKTGNLVFVSGQTGMDQATGKPLEGVEAQAKQALTNLETILRAAGLSLADVVKTTIFLTDMADFAAVNGVYGEVMGASPPARSTVAVAALPLGASVEIEVVADAS